MILRKHYRTEAEVIDDRCRVPRVIQRVWAEHRRRQQAKIFLSSERRINRETGATIRIIARRLRHRKSKNFHSLRYSLQRLGNYILNLGAQYFLEKISSYIIGIFFAAIILYSGLLREPKAFFHAELNAAKQLNIFSFKGSISRISRRLRKASTRDISSQGVKQLSIDPLTKNDENRCIYIV